MPTNLPFWRDPAEQVKEPNFFDEGPNLSLNKSTSVFTSSIDTSAIDSYRQGVEITQNSHWNLGAVKISAGEPGHALAVNRFGENKTWDTINRFEDKDYFNAVRFVASSYEIDPATQEVLTPFTFPIITSDNEQMENFNFNGIIEPLTIRSIASFFSIDVPFDAHEVRGTFMAGNTDSLLSTEEVLTVDYFSLRETKPFLDMVEMFGKLSTVGFFINNQKPRDPFTDARYVENVVHSASIGADMLAVQSLMTGSTDNYVPHNKISATSGWTFDSVAGVGTDSITFGGRVH